MSYIFYAINDTDFQLSAANHISVSVSICITLSVKFLSLHVSWSCKSSTKKKRHLNITFTVLCNLTLLHLEKKNKNFSRFAFGKLRFKYFRNTCYCYTADHESAPPLTIKFKIYTDTVLQA